MALRTHGLFGSFSTTLTMWLGVACATDEPLVVVPDAAVDRSTPVAPRDAPRPRPDAMAVDANGAAPTPHDELSAPTPTSSADRSRLPMCSPEAAAPVRDAGAPWSDAGAPPSDCLAPCVWEAVKGCLPRGTCAVAEGPLDVDPIFDARVACADRSTWWNVFFDSVAPLYGSAAEVSRWSYVHVDGELCTAFYEVRRCSRFDGCGGVERLWWREACTIATERLGTVECFDGTTYDVDPDQPHCEPWRAAIDAALGWFSCAPGMCAGEPPWLPEIE